MYVANGDGTRPIHNRVYFPMPVSPGNSWTAWWMQGEVAYDKDGSHVLSVTSAGPDGPGGVLAGWGIFFLPDGEFSLQILN